MIKKVVLLAVIIIFSVLAYGYWHMSTHGWLYISLNGLGMVKNGQKYENIKNAEIALLTHDGNLLAKGKSDNNYGVVYLAHPEFGYCVEGASKTTDITATKQSWYDCYKKQSKWLIDWVRQVEYMDVAFGTCRLKKIPVVVSESTDPWWLWWVPHPHIGGMPITYFNVSLYFDVVNCVELKPY